MCKDENENLFAIYEKEVAKDLEQLYKSDHELLLEENRLLRKRIAGLESLIETISKLP